MKLRSFFLSLPFDCAKAVASPFSRLLPLIPSCLLALSFYLLLLIQWADCVMSDGRETGSMLMFPCLATSQRGDKPGRGNERTEGAKESPPVSCPFCLSFRLVSAHQPRRRKKAKREEAAR
jgi:hypothetical protein